MVPADSPGDVAANSTTIAWEPPGLMVPLVQLNVYPAGAVTEDTTRAAVPVLLMVIVFVVVVPASTGPKARSPLMEIAGDVGTGGGADAVGELGPPPHAETP